MADDVEIKLSLKDLLSSKIEEIAKLFDELNKNVDLTSICGELADVQFELTNVVSEAASAEFAFKELNSGVDLSAVRAEIDSVITALERLGEIDLSAVVGEIDSVRAALRGIGTAASVAKSEVTSLKREIESLRSKTIVITVIRRTIYKTEGSSGGGSSGAAAGSNPYSEGGGRPTLSTAQAKVFTEQVTLPALKTLAREGKVEEVVR